MSQDRIDTSKGLIEFSDQPKEITTYDPYLRGTIPDDDLDLREIWNTIVKYRWVVTTFFSVILLTVVLGTLLMRPIYRSTALIEVMPNKQGLVKFQNVDDSPVESREFVRTQESIIKSESVAKAVFEELKLDKNPEINGEIQQRGFIVGIKQIRKVISNFFKNNEQEIDQSFLKERKDLKRYFERLSVNPVNNTNLYKVNFDSFNPEVSALVANTVVDEYIRLSDERRFNSTSGAKSYLNKEIKRIQAKLETSEKDLTEFARQNNIVDLEDKNNILNTRLQEINTALTQIQNERIAAESNLKQLQQDFDSNPEVLQESLIKILKEEYATLQAEYFKLSKLFKPAYPKLLQLKAQMDKVEETLQNEVQKIIKSASIRVDNLIEHEEKLNSEIEGQNQALLNLQDRATQYNILKREWETNKELYSGLLERMKEIGVAAGLELDNINIIDRAVVPTDKFKPSLFLNALIASVIGLVGGLGLAFLLAYLDNTVQTPVDLEKALNIPSLGLIPKYDQEKADRLNSVELIAFIDKNSELSESFRSIRTSLMFSSPSGAPKVLMLTSASASEGKTTTTINLAIAYAQNGSKVLLVDSDLRRPRIHKIFNFPSSPGLSEYLVGQGELEIRDSEIDNLSILTAGTIPPNPAEILGSNRFQELLEELRDRYDHIIIDCPPVLGIADSIIISTKVDGLLFIVRAKSVSKDALQETYKRLRMVRAPILGAVLNQVELDAHGYGIYRQYYYKYSLSSEDQFA